MQTKPYVPALEGVQSPPCQHFWGGEVLQEYPDLQWEGAHWLSVLPELPHGWLQLGCPCCPSGCPCCWLGCSCCPLGCLCCWLGCLFCPSGCPCCWFRCSRCPLRCHCDPSGCPCRTLGVPCPKSQGSWVQPYPLAFPLSSAAREQRAGAIACPCPASLCSQPTPFPLC